MSGADGDVTIDGRGLSEEEVRLILARRVEAALEVTAPREVGLAAIVCLIGGEPFAVPLAAVAEVTPALPIVRVPTAPPSLLGLINRRGLVYNLIDPCAALGVASRPSAHCLLLRGPAPRLALRVDEAVAAREIAMVEAEGGGLTTSGTSDELRVEVIVLAKLHAALGLSEE